MIDKIIGDLLLKHNCVIVPGFGGFVAKKSSARIDYVSGTMLPPSKSLLFNRQLINNDGLLVNTLATEANINFADAQIEVDKQVKLWQSILKNEGRVELDKIGFLFLDAEKNLCFEQDRFFNLLVESYGLGEIHFLTQEDVQIAEHMATVKEERIKEVQKDYPHSHVPQLDEIEEETPVVELKPQITPTVERKKSKTWKYLAAACLLPIGFYTFWLPMKTDVLESGMLSLSDFNPFHKKAEAKYTPSSEISIDFKTENVPSVEEQVEALSIESNVYSLKIDDENYIHVNLEDEKEEEVLTEDVAPIQSEEDQVFYIVGCFSNKSNADNLLKSLHENGFDKAKEIDVKNGLHRISAGSGKSIDDLSSVRSQANSLSLEGWILKK